MENFNTLTVRRHHRRVDLVNDGWTEIIRNLVCTLRRRKANRTCHHGGDMSAQGHGARGLPEDGADPGRVEELVADPDRRGT
jgi:hypothetical protein